MKKRRTRRETSSRAAFFILACGIDRSPRLSFLHSFISAFLSFFHSFIFSFFHFFISYPRVRLPNFFLKKMSHFFVVCLLIRTFVAGI